MNLSAELRLWQKQPHVLAQMLTLAALAACLISPPVITKTLYWLQQMTGLAQNSRLQ